VQWSGVTERKWIMEWCRMELTIGVVVRYKISEEEEEEA
jgi:hypothetical protein